jgi:hypothetical protein
LVSCVSSLPEDSEIANHSNLPPYQNSQTLVSLHIHHARYDSIQTLLHLRAAPPFLDHVSAVYLSKCDDSPVGSSSYLSVFLTVANRR